MKTYEIRELYKDKIDAGSWRTIETFFTKEEAIISLETYIEYAIIDKLEDETNEDYFKIKESN